MPWVGVFWNCLYQQQSVLHYNILGSDAELMAYKLSSFRMQWMQMVMYMRTASHHNHLTLNLLALHIVILASPHYMPTFIYELIFSMSLFSPCRNLAPLSVTEEPWPQILCWQIVLNWQWLIPVFILTLLVNLWILITWHQKAACTLCDIHRAVHIYVAWL